MAGIVTALPRIGSTQGQTLRILGLVNPQNPKTLATRRFDKFMSGH